MTRRQTVTPLLVGTLILRANSGAGTIVLGLLLAHMAASTAHKITSVQVGLLPVAFYISELTLAPLMGGLSDRWGRRAFLALGPVFGLAQAALLFFTPAQEPLPYLLSLQVLAGLSGAITVPTVLGYMADLTVHDQSRRVRVMSLYELVTSGGIAVGTVMGGLLWFWFRHGAFVFLAASYVLVIWCMWLSPVANQIVSHEKKLAETAKRYLRILSMPRLLAFLPAWLCISALVGIWLSSQLTFILSTPVRYPHQLLMGSMSGPGGGRMLSLTLGGIVLFFSLSLLFWAFFLQRIARLRLMFTSIIGVYLACIALFGINHRGAGSIDMVYVWLPLLLVGIFAETSFAPAALAYLADISEEAAKDRGMVMGLYSIFLGLGQILGNGLGGMFAHRFGFDGLIYLTALLALVALLSLFWLFKKDRKYSSGISTYVSD